MYTSRKGPDNTIKINSYFCNVCFYFPATHQTLENMPECVFNLL